MQVIANTINEINIFLTENEDRLLSSKLIGEDALFSKEAYDKLVHQVSELNMKSFNYHSLRFEQVLEELSDDSLQSIIDDLLYRCTTDNLTIFNKMFMVRYLVPAYQTLAGLEIYSDIEWSPILN